MLFTNRNLILSLVEPFLCLTRGLFPYKLDFNWKLSRQNDARAQNEALINIF